MEDDAAGRSFDRHARAGALLVLLISFGAFSVTSPLVVWDTGLFSQLCPLFSDQGFLDGMYGSFFLALLGLALAGTVLALERGTSCLPRRFVRLGCALYAVGCALFLSCAMGAVPAGPCLGVACGLCLALGTAALASFWSLVFSRFTVRSALLRLSLACGVAGALGIAYATGFLSGLPVMFVCLVLTGLVAPLSGRYAGTAPTAPSGPPENEKADLRCDRGASNDDLDAAPCAGLWGSVRPAVAVPCLGLFLFVYDASARTFVYEPYSHISTWSILLGSAVLLALVVRWRQFSLTSVYRVLLPGAAALFIVLSAFPVGSVFFGFGYLVLHVLMGAIALLALASLCGVAHAGEFPPCS